MFGGMGVAATFSKQMAGFRSVLLGYVIKLLTFRFSHKLTGAKGYRNGASAEAVRFRQIMRSSCIIRICSASFVLASRQFKDVIEPANRVPLLAMDTSVSG